MEFSEFFERASGCQPWPWQENLGNRNNCDNRMIRIPTGMGKTWGILTTWLYHRVVRKDDCWPRRLVWCLPMRVLVEQVATEIREVFKRTGHDNIKVHLLMGGADDGKWYLHPEHNAVLIGTQDMLISRALNRGYGSPRARWPIEYAFLQNDSLWIMDEVQLMGVGLATSTQLQAFRETYNEKNMRPCFTWWMSATLQDKWLNTIDFAPYLQTLKEGKTTIDKEKLSGGLWEVQKSCRIVEIQQNKSDKNRDDSLALYVQEQHKGGLTLVIVNTVDRAIALWTALVKIYEKSKTDIRLIHSRFRELERRHWVESFLHRRHCSASVDRIIVSTQVIEAGVDISADILITELAPWPSLVQRFGRAARYGGSARVSVIDRKFTEKTCAPYEFDELKAAKHALSTIEDVSIKALEVFERNSPPNLLDDLYPYTPLHVLTNRDNIELFDTGVDLTGTDLDISRFIRTGEERDLAIFWAEWDGDTPPESLQPLRCGLCPVPVDKARDWIKKLADTHAWMWDYLDNRWIPAKSDKLRPGITVLVDTAVGGYQPDIGFTGGKPRKNEPLVDWENGILIEDHALDADRGQDREDQSRSSWKTIAWHGYETGQEACRLFSTLVSSHKDIIALLHLAGRLHDWGKAHIAFQSNMQDRPADDCAKAPQKAWKSADKLYDDDACGKRSGFRHELASTCAILQALAEYNRQHPAILGNYSDYVDAGILAPPPAEGYVKNILVDEINTLDMLSLNTLLYLVCAHHGKIRATWQAIPHDQEFKNRFGKMEFMGNGQPLRGLREDDELPACRLSDPDGNPVEFPTLRIHLDAAALGLSRRYGESWTERCLGLLDAYGPYTLAWLESILRVADIRVSMQDTHDPLLNNEENS